MARPSTYDETKDYDKLASDYLRTCGREQTKLPKISEFCREYVGVHYQTVDEWLLGKQIPEGANTDELRHAIKEVKEAQEEQLIDDGSYGGKEVNSTMMIFLLKANHGKVEASRLELVGKDGQPLTINVKLDLAGGYIPPMGGTFTTSRTSATGFTPVQDTGVAQKSKKNDNSTNGDSKASAI